ncbi:MAG: hypothetical protein HOP02_04600 [Methylococcaceae bacterium]|nr:hypothetical protein [Methylococcaceae bacterium]
MQQTIIINDKIFKNASRCAGLDDVNEVIKMALLEFNKNHQAAAKRRHPPASIAGKPKSMMT